MSEKIIELYVCRECGHIELELNGECPDCAGEMVCTDFVPASEIAAMRTVVQAAQKLLNAQAGLAIALERLSASEMKTQ